MDIAQHSKDYRSPGAERLVEGGVCGVACHGANDEGWQFLSHSDS